MENKHISDIAGVPLDTVEYLDSNGAFQLAPFTLPNAVREHCMEPISDTETLIYGGSNTANVYTIDLTNNGAVTTKAPLLTAGIIEVHASCGSYKDGGDLYVIYAGGESSL